MGPVRPRVRRRSVAFLLVAIVAAATGGRWWPTFARALHVESVGTRSLEAGEPVGPFRVVHVVDGDTIDVADYDFAGERSPKERIRLLRIDTPERGQPGYERATAAMKALVEGRDVTLVFEQPGRPDHDVYHRLLAYVFLGELDVDLEMVRRGWTRFHVKFGEGRFAEQFRAAEDEARAKNAGLWSAEGWNVSAEPAQSRRSRSPR
jgi:endonuclease YncB( thermonuclease family)